MLKNKTALITGGSRGIGWAMAQGLAREGANIVLNYRSRLEEGLINKIEALGVQCIAAQGDVSSFEDAKALVDKALERFGSLDILVNNAGVTKDGLLMRMSPADFDICIDINLKGAFNLIRHSCPVMLKQKSGRIINIASVVGQTGNAGQANYAASKAGLIGLTKATARELASRGITCNAIAPGFIETDMTDILKDSVKETMLQTIPLKRFGQCEDVVKAALFLADSPYVTGQVINVDGGMVM